LTTPGWPAYEEVVETPLGSPALGYAAVQHQDGTTAGDLLYLLGEGGKQDSALSWR
jgi:hypothetical protein